MKSPTKKFLRPCRVKGCPNNWIARNLCAAHLRRLRIHGSLQPHKPIKKRIFGQTIIKYSEYGIWRNMRYRCNNPKSNLFKHYGARGIKVCKRWDDFWKFIDDMGPRPGREFSVDRINNNRGYSPSNCRWATALQQRHNQRPRSK